jgi:hypothetical protein
MPTNPTPKPPRKMVSIPKDVLYRLFSDLSTLHCHAVHGGRGVSVAGCEECDFICENVCYLLGVEPIEDFRSGPQISVEVEVPTGKKQ